MEFFYGLLHMDTQVLADQQKLTLISSVRTLDAGKKTFWEQLYFFKVFSQLFNRNNYLKLYNY